MSAQQRVLHVTVSDPQQDEKNVTSYRVDVEVRDGAAGASSFSFSSSSTDGVLVKPPSDAKNGNEQDSSSSSSSSDPWKNDDQTDAIAAPVTVRRRYTDFTWLYHRLRMERPGSIVPIIPHRHLVSWRHDGTIRFLESLVHEEARTTPKDLESFVNDVVVHPELCDALCLNSFLRADEESFELIKKREAVGGLLGLGAGGGNVNGGGDGLNILYRSIEPKQEDATTLPASPEGKSSALGRINRKEKLIHFLLRTAVSFSIMSGRGVRLEKTSDEPTFEKLEQFVQSLETHVKALSKQASGLVRSSKDDATWMHEIGQTLRAMIQTHATGGKEEEQSDANNVESDFDIMLNQTSTTAETVSKLGNYRVERETRAFEQSMHDLARMVQSMKLALQQRKDAQVTYTARLMQVDHKRVVEKLDGKPTHADKAESAQLELQSAEKAAFEAFEELDKISKRLLREVNRVKGNINEQIRKTMMIYGEIQVEHSRKVEEEWKKLLPHLTPSLNESATLPKEEKQLSSIQVPTSDEQEKVEDKSTRVKEETSSFSVPSTTENVEENQDGRGRKMSEEEWENIESS